ncbi:BatD family protein [Vibrio comitans]|uniref:Protein BatD n=1 Tax=Vibrio comitans NBRC 102076 TaxID=1219078 RepID=A0A4Y3INR7_9VIBR|nr:BatD family protein [Vibrio comitans]GEA61139.1 hypothetical protein VCO01S_23320 [Vibrio comitans NBRC 102076]
MKMRTRCLILSILFSLVTGFSHTAVADGQRPNVIVKTWIAEDQPVSVRQKVTVMVQIMTDTWFIKGTQIHDIEVPNALVLGKSAFAENSTVRNQGQMYTSQTWEIVLYPLTAGDYVIPNMTIEYQVKGAIANTFVTKELTFTAHQPSAQMHDSLPWLVSPQTEVFQTWEVTSTRQEVEKGVSDEFLAIGDVIQRTVNIEALDTTVMLLPELNVQSSASYNAYSHVLQSNDKIHRGVHTAYRTQKLTYQVTEAGQVVIPHIELLIWDPVTQNMTSKALHGRTFPVRHTLKSWLMSHWLTLLMVSTITSLISIILVLGYNRFQVLKAHGALPLSWYYFSALQQKDHARCESLLYRYYLDRKGLLSLQVSRSKTDKQCRIAQLQQTRYGKEANEEWLSMRFFLVLWLTKNSR